ncbi:FxsA family protein [Chitinivorax sp. PXF-14]|uniref:FxsA family protein n=1 Tax=Chitinivorax sp. PXF-14 TaxID=3230488 RepID=UPI0034677E1F
MLRIGGLILLGFPLLELAFTLWVGTLIGPWIWLLLLGSALTGWLVLRGQRVGAPLLMLQALRNGDPIGGVLWNVRIALSGVLLIVPGLLSDIAALALLLPWRLRPVPVSARAASPDYIDGEYRRMD